MTNNNVTSKRRQQSQNNDQQRNRKASESETNVAISVETMATQSDTSCQVNQEQSFDSPPAAPQRFRSASSDRLTPSDVIALLRHIVTLDSVFEKALHELRKQFPVLGASRRGKLPTGIADFCDEQSSLGGPAVIIKACDALAKEGLKPSSPDFKERLSHWARSTAEQAEMGTEQFLIETTEDCLSDLYDAPAEVSEAHGLALLKRYLCYRTFDLTINYLTGCAPYGQSTDYLFEGISVLKDCLEGYRRFGSSDVMTIDNTLADHVKQLESNRGRSLIGLKSGIEPLDRRTNGVRGLTLICSPPNIGKTALVLEVALGVARNWENNSCAVLLVSLDMTSHELVVRMLSSLSQLTWETLNKGDSSKARTGLSRAATKQFNNALKLLDQCGRRIGLADRDSIGQGATGQSITELAARLKERTQASTVLIIVDYLQLLDRGGHTGVDADKFQIDLLKQLVAAGHTVIAISEVRKPASSKEPYGKGITDVKGDGRVAYAADAVILLEPMNNDEIAACYDLSPAQAKVKARMQRQLDELQAAGKSPICLHLVKARDGMSRGREYFEFQFRTSRLVPLNWKKPDAKEREEQERDEYFAAQPVRRRRKGGE